MRVNLWSANTKLAPNRLLGDYSRYVLVLYLRRPLQDRAHVLYVLQRIFSTLFVAKGI